MLQQFQHHLQNQFPFLSEKRLFLAVSGGVDSMVLLHLMHQLHYDIAVLNCNFSLRDAESDGDTAFVKDYCAQREIPFQTITFATAAYATTQKVSIQAAARTLRYEWFGQQLLEQERDYVLTAHHLDDSLETVLINLSRGTGLEGLTGIPAQNDNVIRPLLPFSRQCIEDYAAAVGLQWREDSSNATTKYVRNKLRHDVIPELKALQPQLLDTFQQTLLHLQQAQSLVEDAAQMVYKEIVSGTSVVQIDLKKLLRYPNYQAYLYQWLNQYGFTAWQDIYNLVHAQSGKQVFSEGFVLLKDRDRFLLSPIAQTASNEVYWIESMEEVVKIPLNIAICQVADLLDTTPNCIFVDGSKLQFPLTIRKYNAGDWFYPFGMEGKKKLSKYFKDEKMALIDKASVWVLCSQDQVVWIINKRMDNRFRVTEETKTIVKITTT